VISLRGRNLYEKHIAVLSLRDLTDRLSIDGFSKQISVLSKSFQFSVAYLVISLREGNLYEKHIAVLSLRDFNGQEFYR
jgi:hypothetical protein